ncbi:MAG: hypothetical protein WCP08_11770 [Prolixibacteraceae bacterium]
MMFNSFRKSGFQASVDEIIFSQQDTQEEMVLAYVEFLIVEAMN